MSVSLRLATDGPGRPPRLQPSPSLPNLRARNFASDPQSTRPQHKQSSQIVSVSPAILPPNSSVKDGDLQQTKRSRQPSRNQHYLTPPLTPASSLKSDGTDPDTTDLAGHNGEQSPPNGLISCDSSESRFLIIGNVPSDLSEDVIGPYFHSLAAPSDGSSLPLVNSQCIPNTGNIIQTIYYQFQEKLAIILAFYDIRDSERVKRLIESNTSRSRPTSDVEDRKRASSDSTPWADLLTCLFVAPDHFVQLLGQSAVTTRTEGSFYVSAGGMMAGRDHNYSGWSRFRFCVPVKLKSVLAKFGELKSFRLLKEDEEKCNQLFIIEYYDVRAGDLAWESLNGHVVDNMKLRFIQRDALRGGPGGPRDLGKEDLVDLEGHLGSAQAAEPKTPTASTYLSQSHTIPASSGVPFPLLNEAVPCDYPRPCEHEGANATSLNAASAVNSHKSSIPDRPKPTFRYPLDSIESIADQTFTIDHPTEHTGRFGPDQFGRRESNNIFSDAVRSRTHHKEADPDCTRTANMNGLAFDRSSQVPPFEVAQVAGGGVDLCTPHCSGAQSHFAQEYFTHDRYAVDASMHPPWVSSSLAHGAQYPVPQPPIPPVCSSVYYDASTCTWVAWGAPGILPEQWPAFPATGYYHGAASQAVPYSYPLHTTPPPTTHPYGTTPNRVYPTTYPTSPRAPTENNQLDIRKIEQGLDTRTTVMIKNIPNKMTDKELIAYINKICPRRIDFLYLRMDFQNGCNVGYAFVNFISVEDLLQFAKATLGEKWNMYSSEKVLQMSYANYQGKEALVEKFKNSCIMDEREEWRPKIFFSDPGPNQGLPEEFPKPTHMRRKERSSYNRGALFVPGISGGAGYSRTFLNATPHHQRTGRLVSAAQSDERQRRSNYPANDNNVQ